MEVSGRRAWGSGEDTERGQREDRGGAHFECAEQ